MFVAPVTATAAVKMRPSQDDPSARRSPAKGV